MRIIHLDLKPVKDDYVELRLFLHNPNNYDSRCFPLGEIKKLIDKAEAYYYTSPEDLAKIGKQLYDWLDNNDRYLEKNLNNLGDREIILAIATAGNLAHLPWEVLHDGKQFLVENSIVPVRWLSSDSSKNKLSIDKKKKNRALQVLFMASSPIDKEPVLDYEAEEARILEATNVDEPRKSLALIVEESGSLPGLGEIVNPSKYGTFDILHLTGHATIEKGKPFFITETETGEPWNTSAKDIADKLEFRLPKLVFLSGCHTGQASKLGAVPSMAEEFLRQSSVKAILGWGNKVLDTDATQAAKVLYKELSQGKQVAQAVAKTYKALIQINARDWHLLRLYTGDTLPGELVTDRDALRREPAPLQSVATRLFDPKGDRKVPTPETFVGRRRQLQKCYKNLINTPMLLIHGMGGLGKSSLALRLCDRYPQRERVVWIGRVDEQSLVNELAAKLKSPKLRKRLQSTNTREILKYRLRDLFQELNDKGEKSFLLVLDDFEHNLELSNDKYKLTSEAASVLEAIVWAIKNTYSSNRIIITCRYDFDFTDSQDFYKQPLDALQGADLQKKWNRLTASDNKFQKDETLRSQVEKLADGNHRLLEKLYETLKKTNIGKTSVLSHLEAELPELLQQVLKQELRDQINQDSLMQKMLQRGLVFELPVPMDALKAVCETIAKDELDKCIDKAVALGLLGVSHDQLLRVPRYLGLEKLDEISLNKKAAKELYDFWDEQAETKTKISEERLLEIHRLAQLGNEIEIEAEITEKLATRWNSQRSRCQKVVQMCTSVLERLESSNLLEEYKDSVLKIQKVLASSYLFQKCYTDAESLNKKMLENISDKDTLILAEISNDLGYVYTCFKRYEEAKSLLDSALKIRQEKLPAEHLDLVKSLSHLAYWHRVQCHWNETENFYKEALEMCKRLQENKEEGIFLAERHHNLGAVYYEQALYIETTHDNDNKELSIKTKNEVQKLYEKAENFYCKALNISPNLRNESLSKATFLSSLAKVYCCQEKDREAQKLFREALNIREKLLGMHFEIVADLKNLGFINYRLENYQEAKTDFFKALKLIKNLIDSQDNSVSGNQGRVFRYVEEIMRLKYIFNKQEYFEKDKNICESNISEIIHTFLEAEGKLVGV